MRCPLCRETRRRAAASNLSAVDSEPAIGPIAAKLPTTHPMPGMTGTELAVVAKKKCPRLPVLLTTGYADLPNGQNTDLPRLSKPYDQAQLQKEINRLLP